MEIDVVILAGGNASDLDSSASCKGLVEIRSKPMIEYVVDALRACPPVRRIVAVLPDSGEGGWRSRVDHVVTSSRNIVDNFMAGVEALPGSDRILTLSADIPLISPEAIADFLEKCRPFDADLYYPIVTKAGAEKKFPGVQRTYVHLRDGVFTGGNMMLLNPETIARNRQLMESIYAARKSPFKLVGILGWGFVLKFVFRLLTIDELERKVSCLIGGKGKAVVVEYAEVGVDVDKPADLVLAARMLGEAANWTSGQ